MGLGLCRQRAARLLVRRGAAADAAAQLARASQSPRRVCCACALHTRPPLFLCRRARAGGTPLPGGARSGAPPGARACSSVAPRPLYSPRAPSSRTIVRSACAMPW